LNFIPTRENTLIGKRRMDKPFGIGPLPEPELSRLPDELDSLVIPLADKSDVSGSYSYNTGISRKFLDMLHRGLDFDSTAVAEFEQQVETFAGKLRGTPSGNLKEKNDVNNFKKVIFPQWVDAILRYASSGKSVHQAVLRDRLQLIVDRHKAN